MAKSSRSKAIKKKNANKREKLTKATDQRMQRLAEKMNQIIAADNEDGGLMPLLPTDADSMKAVKIILDPTRDDDKMDGVQAISAAPSSSAIGKNKRKKIGRK